MKILIRGWQGGANERIMTKPKRSRIAFNRFAKTPFETIVSHCHTHRGHTPHPRPDCDSI